MTHQVVESILTSTIKDVDQTPVFIHLISSTSEIPSNLADGIHYAVTSCDAIEALIYEIRTIIKSSIKSQASPPAGIVRGKVSTPLTATYSVEVRDALTNVGINPIVHRASNNYLWGTDLVLDSVVRRIVPIMLTVNLVDGLIRHLAPTFRGLNDSLTRFDLVKESNEILARFVNRSHYPIFYETHVVCDESNNHQDSLAEGPNLHIRFLYLMNNVYAILKLDHAFVESWVTSDLPKEVKFVQTNLL